MRKLLAIIIILTFIPTVVYSEAEVVASYEQVMSKYDFPGLDKEISLDIRSMDIIHFLKFLAIEGDLNIVAKILGNL